MRILIAEDEKRARRGLKSVISFLSEDYEVVAEASDGKQALELIQIVQPDVVFTDLKMPYMDGMSLIKAAQNAGSKAKYVIVSAYEEFEMARQAISLGVVEYLVKPITVDEVQELMKRLEKEILADEKEEAWEGELREQYKDVHPLVRKALRYIQKEYAAKINQGELAESFGISQEYFSSLFTRDIGEPFSKFVKRYRIEAAKRLLKGSERSKEEIAEEVGFSDSKYFNRVLKEITGMRVTEYIRKA